MEPDLPAAEFALPGPLRDLLVAAVESGAKTATSSLLREYEISDEPIPLVGARRMVVDSNGLPRFVIETVGVEIRALRDIPLSHALAEGEGYESVPDWRVSHERFWSSPEMREELGADFELDDSTLIVLERFARVP